MNYRVGNTNIDSLSTLNKCITVSKETGIQSFKKFAHFDHKNKMQTFGNERCIKLAQDV